MPGHDANPNVVVCAAQPHNGVCVESVLQLDWADGSEPPADAAATADGKGGSRGVMRFKVESADFGAAIVR